MKKYIILFYTICLSYSIMAQILPETTPSPEAGNLGTVTQLPFNHYTGQVNIEIPLINVEESGINIPIKLKYNASGITATSRVSWVGANWTLEAGGIVTRSVRGKPDEDGIAGFEYRGKELLNQGWATPEFINQNIIIPMNFNQVRGASIEPDEFYFNANGISGKFFMDNNGKIQVIGRPDIQVNFSENKSGFGGSSRFRDTWVYIEIIMPDGTKYNFTTKDISTNLGSVFPTSSRGIPYASSWLLTSVILPHQQDTIYYKYSEAFIDHGNSYRKIFIDAAYEYKNGFFTKVQRSCSNNVFDEDNQIILEHHYLASIENRNFKLEFSLAPNNNSKNAGQTPNWRQLEAITLYRKSDGERIKKIKFAYDSPDAFLRYWLNSVTTYGKTDEEKLPPYIFSYYPYTDLPKGYNTKFKVDHWGYYRSGGEVIIPEIVYEREGRDVYYKSGKEPKTEDIIKGMLKTITYPTGGTIELNYESNDFSEFLETRTAPFYNRRKVSKVWSSSASSLVAAIKDIGGGLRISKLTYSDKGKHIASYVYKYITDFNPSVTYNETNSFSSGILGETPVYEYEINVNVIYPSQTITENLKYSASSSQTLSTGSLAQGSPIGYSEVTEIYYDTDNNLDGYTKYKFSNFDSKPDIEPDLYVGFTRSFFSTYNSMESHRGLLVNKEVYDTDYKLKSKVSYTYSAQTDHIRAIQLKNLNINSQLCGINAGFAVSAYRIYLHTPDLVKEEETTYGKDNTHYTTSTTEYEYNTKKQLKAIRRIMSDKDKVYTTRLYYPHDYISQSEVYQKMTDNNIIAPVIYKEEYMIDASNRNKVIKKEKYNYKMLNSTLPVVSDYQEINGDAPLKTRIEYKQHDKYGNPVEIVINGIESIVFLWGYNYKYVVAEIKNATLSEVTAIIGDLDVFCREPIPNQSKLINLREGLLKAQVYTSTIEPLVGKTSETNAKGVTTYFEFDKMSRLQYIRDYHGNILEGYLYHYSEN